MCTGAEIALIAAAVVSATATVAQADAAANEAKAQGLLRQQQAERQRELARLQEERQRRDSERLQGRQRAFLAASGVDPAAGSALLLQENLARDAEFNALLTRAQGEADARALDYQARLDRQRARNLRTAGYLNAGTTLLTKGGQVYASQPSAPPSTSAPAPAVQSFLYHNYRTPYD
jgi:hypothetical protein